MSNCNLPGKERIRQAFEKMTGLMMRYPILSQIDTVATMQNHGVCFTCDVKVASMIFQSLYRCFLDFQSVDQEERMLAITLMRDGIIDKIVID